MFKSFIEIFLLCEFSESLRAVIEQTNRQLIAGDRLYLRCKTYGYPTPNVIWEKLGVPLESSGRLTVVGEHLRISNITVDDGGLYTCIASNNEEKAEDSITISISPRGKMTLFKENWKFYLMFYPPVKIIVISR